MKNLLLIDTNNWVRVKMSESLGGASIFTLYQEVMANSLAGKIQVFISDGVNSRKKRKEIYPDYKARRKPADQSVYDGINFFKELLINMPSNVWRIEIPEWEADDVIANLVEKSFIGMDLGIISTDRDLTQLRVHQNVETLKEPIVPAKWVKLYKMFVGDSSDNIPGIKGFGDSAWEKLSSDFKDRFTCYLHFTKGKVEEKVLERMLAKEALLSENMKEKVLEENKSGNLYKWYRLVSFFNIPDDLLKIEQGTGKTYLNDEKIEEYFLAGDML